MENILEIELTRSQKISLGYTEIAALIRKRLKTEFPNCKFSVTKESYSMGGTITIVLMEAPFEAFKSIDSIDKSIPNYDRLIKSIQSQHCQINPYVLNEEHPILTDEAREIMQRVFEISQKWNYDNSDPQTDYSDVNFYLHLEIGKGDKPFKRSVQC